MIPDTGGRGRSVASLGALKTAGLLMLTLKFATAAAQAVLGVVADRVNRSRLRGAALLMTGLSLASIALVHDVFSLAPFVMIGLLNLLFAALGATMLFRGRLATPTPRRPAG